MQVIICISTLIIITVTHVCSASESKCLATGVDRTDNSGKIVSPGYDGAGYSNNMNCVWNLKTSIPRSFLVIKLVNVQMEALDCIHDKLEMDKVTICGNETNQCIVYKTEDYDCENDMISKEYGDCYLLRTSSWPMQVKFTTNDKNTFKGFHIEYEHKSCQVKKPAEPVINVDDGKNASGSSSGVYIGVGIACGVALLLIVVMTVLIVSRKKARGKQNIESLTSSMNSKEKEALDNNMYHA